MTKILFSIFVLLSALGSLYGQESQDAVKPLKILFIGDSLSAGYGVSKEDSYPSLFEVLASKKLKKPIKVMNGSVSGSTTASGLGRLNWYLKADPDWLILALGANDGLRGLEVKSTREHLEKIILKAKGHDIKVVLAGMLMPKNYGEEYRNKFSKAYQELSKKYETLLIPFLLEGVALKKELNQSDGIHPNEKGHQVLANNLWDFMKDHLQ